VAPQSLDQVGPADDDPGLRPAEQLVPRETHQVGSGGQAVCHRRLVLDPPEHA
jgi:hypothetical protein